MTVLDVEKHDDSSDCLMMKKHKESFSPPISSAYDSSFIDKLESDHREIIDLYTKVLKAAEGKDFVVLKVLLVRFSTAFTHHIQVEDKSLYTELKLLACKKSKREQRVIDGFISEMKEISVSVLSFLNQSPYISVDDSTVDGFIVEFTRLGDRLLSRIEREERILYLIYKKKQK